MMEFARFWSYMRGAGIAVLGRGAALLALACISAVGVAQGQSFYPERAALNHFSFVSLSVSNIDDNKSTVDTGGVVEISEEDAWLFLSETPQ